MTDKEKLELCIKELKDIMHVHDVNIIMGDKVIRDRAYYMAKECLDEVMKEIQDDVALKALYLILRFSKT